MSESPHLVEHRPDFQQKSKRMWRNKPQLPVTLLMTIAQVAPTAKPSARLKDVGLKLSHLRAYVDQTTAAIAS